MVADGAGAGAPVPRAHVRPFRRRPLRCAPRTVLDDREVLAFLRRRPDLPAHESAWAFVPYNYGARCRRHHLDRIAEDISRRVEFPFAKAAYRAQLFAGATHDGLASLRRLDVQTLVV